MLTKQRLWSDSYRVIDNLKPPTMFDRDSKGFLSHQIGSIVVREKTACCLSSFRDQPFHKPLDWGKYSDYSLLR